MSFKCPGKGLDETFAVSGNIRRSHGGQIVVDKCESDDLHLRDSVTDPVQNRPLCRSLVESCFDALIGKSGKLTITVRFDEDGVGAIPQAEVHTAETAKVASGLEEAVIAALEQIDGQ